MTQLPGGLDDLYQEIILDHYKRPRNRGRVEEAHLHAEGFNPFCGDQVTLTAHLDEDGVVDGVGFDGQGCSISQASASIMTELLKGKSVDEVSQLAETFKAIMHGDTISEDQEEELGELVALEGVKKFPVRIKCALLAWSTLQDAVDEYQKAGH